MTVPGLTKPKRPRRQHKASDQAPWTLGLLTGLSIAFSVTMLFAVFTWSQFFFFSPFEAANGFSVFLLFSYLVTWPMLIVLPPLAAVLRMRTYPMRALEHTLMFSVGLFLWPLVTVLIKIENATRGVLSTAYWASYPAFILFEIVWPLLGLFVWFLVSAGYGSDTKGVLLEEDSLDEQDLRAFVGDRA
jgi:hypothetical protein